MTQQSSDSSLRYLPLVVGLLGGALLLINRVRFTPDLLMSQSRSDVVGIILSVFLVFVSVLWQQIQPLAPDSVTLAGVSIFELKLDLTEAQKQELGWISYTILSLTPARSILILWDQTILLKRGIFPVTDEQSEVPLLKPGSILDRALKTQKPIYLVDLKLLPAKAEFTHVFPDNTQSILCQPLDHQGALIVGTDTPRNLTKRDQAWIAALAQKLIFELKSDA